jgi:peptidoglycan/LPS O-acetylase OafA/YrhL/lysophospholipase L1-like esterase
MGVPVLGEGHAGIGPLRVRRSSRGANGTVLDERGQPDGGATTDGATVAVNGGDGSAGHGIATGGDAAAERSAGRRLGYLPELDGLRGAGLLAVLAYHHGLGLARGGPLAVSMFFTLSGFLIASLALEEWTRTGGLSFARFWERRARRLLPAALLTLAGIAVVQAVLEVGSGTGFRLDLLSALVYGTNWRLIGSGDDYAALFASPSPLTHFWSLAIEEQFYLAFPIAFALLMGARRRRRVLAGLAFAAAGLASFAVAAVLAGRQGNSGVVYYGTHTRAAEILAGVALAYVLAAPGARRWLTTTAGKAVARGAAVAGVAALALLWHTTSLGDPRLFQGITALNALCTCAVVVAATTRGGPVRSVLGLAPFTALGKVSYGAYLFHWPIFLVLDQSRTGLDYRPLFALRVGVTLAAAALSYWLLERPFRLGTFPPTRLKLGAGLAVAGLAVAVLVASLPEHESNVLELDMTADAEASDEFNLRSRDVIGLQAGQVAANVLAVGDSVSWSLLPGLSTWNRNHTDRQLRVDTHIAFGCPLSGPGEWEGPSGRVWTFPGCDSWLPGLPAALQRSSPSVVVMLMGMADIGGREIDGEWYQPGDPVFDAWFSERLDGVADALASGGDPVVWLTYPRIRVADRHDPTRSPDDIALNEPHRVEALNAAISEAVEGRPGFSVVDLNGWVESWPEGQFDTELRDGVHFTLAGSGRAGEWLAPHLIAAAAGSTEAVPAAPVP